MAQDREHKTWSEDYTDKIILITFVNKTYDSDNLQAMETLLKPNDKIFVYKI